MLSVLKLLGTVTGVVVPSNLSPLSDLHSFARKSWFVLCNTWPRGFGEIREFSGLFQCAQWM